MFDLLCQRHLPPHCQLIEGGIAGLDLLCHLENTGVVVFVDAVSGFTVPGEMTVLVPDNLLSLCPPPRYGHGAGLVYLLAVLPRVCQGSLPREIHVVGLEGTCTMATLERAADTAMALTALPPLASHCH